MQKILVVFGVLAVSLLGAAWWITQPKTDHIGRIFAMGDPQRGELVFNASGCSACHASVGQSNRLWLGGGMKFPTAFGTFVAPNISPHVRDGIGGWSYEMFVNAMQAGVSPKGEHYYPAFPYTSYVKMQPRDVSDLFSFMRTLPQAEGRAPAHDVSFPFNQRRALGFWKFLYLDTKPLVDVSTRSPEWHRGRYLVEAMGHCAECHSARTALGGIDENYRHAGGPDPSGKGRVPNITPGEGGIGSWTKAEVYDLLSFCLTR
jgi:mono/diheme cytochrome c family protein